MYIVNMMTSWIDVFSCILSLYIEYNDFKCEVEMNGTFWEVVQAYTWQ